MPNVRSQRGEEAGGDKDQTSKSLSLPQFFSKYRDVSLVVVSLVLMYFCHFMIAAKGE